MQKYRRERIESLIREELSSLLLRGLKDPRVHSEHHSITFTQVKLSPDAKQAIVFVSVLANQAELPRDQLISNSLKGLESARGFLRKHLAKALTSRNIPDLVFKEDRGLENALRVHELLKQINRDSMPDSRPDSKHDTKSDSGERSPPKV